jgi:hypothetical protein
MIFSRTPVTTSAVNGLIFLILHAAETGLLPSIIEHGAVAERIQIKRCFY